MLRTVLDLVVKQQLVAASAIAAASGDVRLATLIAQASEMATSCVPFMPLSIMYVVQALRVLVQAGASKHGTRALVQQVATWQAAGFSELINTQRFRLFQLLSGDIPCAAQYLSLQWQPALCAQLG